MQKSNLTLFHFYLSFHSKGRKYVTAGGPIQNFTIPNITNVDDDPIFSVSGDIALNWWYYDNGVRISLTGGHLSAQNDNDENTHGLGINLWLKKENRAEEGNPNYKIEISNIQDCHVHLKSKKFKEKTMDHPSIAAQSMEIMLFMFQIAQLNSLSAKI